jgi:hypothetical protein
MYGTSKVKRMYVFMYVCMHVYVKSEKLYQKISIPTP